MYTAAMTTAKKKLKLGDYMKTVIAREGRMCVCVAVVVVVVAGGGMGGGNLAWGGYCFFSGIVKKFDSSLAP